MGKRGGAKRKDSKGGATSSSGLHTSLSIREEASGKKQSHNAKSLLKLKHLKNLAEWVTKEASVPSLGAFYGRRFAEYGEALGLAPDRYLFPCQRCETILQPDKNCTVRIEKNQAKRRRQRSKSNPPLQHNTIYTCHFCSHRNLKRGIPKGYITEIAPSKAKPNLKPKGGDSVAQKCDGTEKGNENKVETNEAGTPTNATIGYIRETAPSKAKPNLKPKGGDSVAQKCGGTEKANENKVETNEAGTPSHATSKITSSLTNTTPAPSKTTGTKLLDSKKRTRKKPASKGSVDVSQINSAASDAEKASGTSRKRKKSWTTLKEIAAKEELERNKRLKDFSIPFLL